ncbi:MAG: hypothetical protein CSA26_08325 [Desulfobacterales bacterium]|nr:MAG: hypothetical protein CSA26_08325 [Desulfobacterales bacterium]
MKKMTVLFIAFLSITVITSTAFSSPHGKGKPGNHVDCYRSEHGYDHHGHVPPFGQKLSQNQKDQLKTLHRQFIDETVATRTAIANIHNEIQMLMETSEPERDKLVSLVKQLEPLKTEMAIKRIDYQLKAKKISPEWSHRFFMTRKRPPHER